MMLKGIKWCLVIVLVAALFALVPWNQAGGQEGVEIGILTCDSLPKTTTQIFLRTAVRVKCTFQASRLQAGGQAGKSEKYVGEFGLLGVDLSKKEAQQMTFTVFGLTRSIKIGSHALKGDYIGVQATAGIGVGGGPNALLGGWKDSFTLAPSLETHKGTGVTIGATRLNLEAAK